MTTLKIAHIREQGQDMIIAPLDSSFDHKTSSQQQAAIAEIQLAAGGAGLKGTVVPVWIASAGKMKFIAPDPWHPFFQGINMKWVQANLNKTLTW
ncbi:MULTISPECIES: hypothetical protein [unclassified Mesorhizobium]|uniref:hypothetical protein n=1 Tax=unclassified Mesorhizobium TaxID=325217 RepID=UPI003336D2F8